MGLITSKQPETIIVEKDIESLETVKRKIKNDTSCIKHTKTHNYDIEMNEVEETVINIITRDEVEFFKLKETLMSYAEMRDIYG